MASGTSREVESLREPPDPETPPPDDEDITLVRWMLSLTPSERLDYLQQHVNAVLEIRQRNEREWTSEPS